MKQKLILSQTQSLGDLVCFTSAIRDLHTCQPGRFITDVRCNPLLREVFDNNPYITPIPDGEGQNIDCGYPLIQSSNQLPYPMTMAFTHRLGRALNVWIEPTAFCGDIHLTEREREVWPDINPPYVLLDAGGKSDFTAKWIPKEHSQLLVDSLKGKYTFVQIGTANPGDYHPKIDGCIDMVGKTTIRELCRLIYNAHCIVTPISSPMHLAAAVPRKGGQLRPCVVIAGAREPRHWGPCYPGHTWLGGEGKLPCSRSGACWNSSSPENANDRRASRCTNAIEIGAKFYPKCISDITPDQIIAAVEGYRDVL